MRGVFIRRSAENLGVAAGVLGARGKPPATVRAREIVAVVGVERLGLKVKDLAARPGKHPGSVSRWVAEGARRRREEREFEASCRRSEAALAKGAGAVSQRS